MEARTVRVERSLTELQNGALAFGPPKSDAGRRAVGFPKLIAPVVREHLSSFAQPEDDSLVFTGPTGALLRRGNFRRRTWLPALRKAGLPVVHFHDLRHTGNNLTATAGANLRELMARMGHSSTRAALIYLHSTDERQREIADALGDLAAVRLKRKASRARKGTAGGRSGTQRAQLLTAFRKTRQHEQRQIDRAVRVDRAVRAQKLCESDHHGPAAGTYERLV